MYHTTWKHNYFVPANTHRTINHGDREFHTMWKHNYFIIANRHRTINHGDRELHAMWKHNYFILANRYRTINHGDREKRRRTRQNPSFQVLQVPARRESEVLAVARVQTAIVCCRVVQVVQTDRQFAHRQFAHPTVCSPKTKECRGVRVEERRGKLFGGYRAVTGNSHRHSFTITFDESAVSLLESVK